MDVLNDLPIDLEFVWLEFREQGKTREARAEIVDCHPNTRPANAFNSIFKGLRACYGFLLGHLDYHVLWR